jgi:hypothetical protein
LLVSSSPTRTPYPPRSSPLQLGLPRTTIIERVLRHGARPSFPPAAPSAYVRLAEACWAAAPSDRPALPEVAQRLREISEALARAARKGADGGGGPVSQLGGSSSSPL